MARVTCARPLVSLLQCTAVRPWCCHYACSTLRMLASHATGLKSNCKDNYSGNGWHTYQVRHLMKASKKLEELLKAKDNIPYDYEIVYRAPLLKYIQFGQIISYLSLITLGSVSAFSMSEGVSVYKLPFTILQTGDDVGFGSMSLIQMSVMLGFFVFVNFVFQRFILSYPLRIYKKGDMYILIKHSYLPFQTRQVTFSKGDFRKGGSKILKLFFSDAVFAVSGNTTIVLDEHFRTPQDFQDMFEPKSE